MKHGTYCLLTLLLALCAAASGSCGDGVEWFLGADGTLTISGQGAMEDYFGPDYNTPYLLAPWAYEKANITSVVIKDGVTAIGTWAFHECDNLKRVSIPGSVTSIGTCAFEVCIGLTRVDIPDGVVSIGSGAFDYCYRLTDVSIPDSVTFIGVSAFGDCENLTRVSIPGSVTTIEQLTFSGCRKLTDVGIPTSVTNIGACAFDGCYRLTDVYYGGSEQQWEQIEIDNYLNGNSELLEAVIHYNSALPNDIPAAGFIAVAASVAVVMVLAVMLKKRKH